MTLTTRLTLLQRAAPYLGGYVGNVTSGTATTAVLEGLVGALNDDDLNDDLLGMPDAATAADQVRIVSDFTGTTGTATFATRADTTYTSETFFTIPRNTWTLQELRQAVSTALRETKRTYRYVVPTRDDEREYQLVALAWLRNADDVDGVQYRPSPNMIFNADFSHWHSGTTTAPDGWTLAGSSATIARSTTFASFGSYVAQVTRSGADATLTSDLPYQLAKQLIDDLATVAIKVRCTASAASRVRVGINDGTTTTYSDYHSGDGEPEDLTVSVTLTAAASKVQTVLSVDTGDTMGSFDFAPMVEGSSVGDDLWRGGDAGYTPQEIRHEVLNVGSGVPVLQLGSSLSRKGQLIVITRRPFADLTSDSASTEAPEDVITAKVIYELASLRKTGMDQARMTELRATWGRSYAQLAKGLIDKPPQRPQTQTVVRGA